VATLQFSALTPRTSISPVSSPAALREALLHIFSMSSKGLWLVGGTAIAGYFAEHRRSDDLDLFALHQQAFQSAVYAVKSLKKLGAEFQRELSTPLFYRTDIFFKGHTFTADVVLDENLGHIGKAFRTTDGVVVADLQTLLAMKIACLVSRCSEKDLFDLDWILAHLKAWSVSDLIELASPIDGGLTVESLLISLQGTILRKSACSFLLPNSSLNENSVYKKITKLQKHFIQLLFAYEKKEPPLSESEAIIESFKQQRQLARHKAKKDERNK